MSETDRDPGKMIMIWNDPSWDDPITVDVNSVDVTDEWRVTEQRHGPRLERVRWAKISHPTGVTERVRVWENQTITCRLNEEGAVYV